MNFGLSVLKTCGSLLLLQCSSLDVIRLAEGYKEMCGYGVEGLSHIKKKIRGMGGVIRRVHLILPRHEKN